MTIIAEINRGTFDDVKQLLTIKANAERLEKQRIVSAVHDRMRQISPKVYRRLIGPLNPRSRASRFDCFCNQHSSLSTIKDYMISGEIPDDALTCDACWQDDIMGMWTHYGLTKKQISLGSWQKLCQKRDSLLRNRKGLI